VTLEQHTYDIEITDTTYLTVGPVELLARIYQPKGDGPFPAIVEVHGGCWCIGDRLMDDAINEPLARNGIVVASLDFRMPPMAAHPAAVIDINYGIRWLKTRAASFRTRPDLVGVLGSSSGSHLAMLAAMRPHDPRYNVLPALSQTHTVDATARFAVLCWPVIDPLSRYHYAQRLKALGPDCPDFVDVMLSLQPQYWGTEDAMAEGSPVLILERGEPVETPPVLYIQGTDDQYHPPEDLDRFVTLYRRAGGHLQLELYEGEAAGFINLNPTSPAKPRALETIASFVHQITQD
jgi:acetyl esterase